MTLRLTENVPPRTLKDFEAVIERSLRTLIVGEALREIRDSKLYTLQYASFKVYCHKRWGFANGRAERLISAAEVAQLLINHGELTSPDGTLAYELSPLIADPNRLIATWKVLSSLDAAPPVMQVRAIVRRVKAAPQDAQVETVVMDAIAENRRPHDSHRTS